MCLRLLKSVILPMKFTILTDFSSTFMTSFSSIQVAIKKANTKQSLIFIICKIEYYNMFTYTCNTVIAITDIKDTLYILLRITTVYRPYQLSQYQTSTTGKRRGSQSRRQALK